MSGHNGAIDDTEPAISADAAASAAEVCSATSLMIENSPTERGLGEKRGCGHFLKCTFRVAPSLGVGFIPDLREKPGSVATALSVGYPKLASAGLTSLLARLKLDKAEVRR